MKTRIYYCCIAAIALMLNACQSTMVDDLVNVQESPMTRAATSWDTCTDCFLTSGGKVKLPWAVGASGSIPGDISNDVKEGDGWKILYTNVSFEGYSANVTPADAGTNYLLLYNIYTGVLKGFCYIEGNVNSNNTALWALSLNTGTTKLFNFAPYFAQPMNNSANTQQLVLTALSKNGASGFEQGWNCFQQELSYDDNSMNEFLDISAFAMNKSKFKMNGVYKSNSSGTIISTTSVKGSNMLSNTLSGVASGTGSVGATWIKDLVQGGTD